MKFHRARYMPAVVFLLMASATFFWSMNSVAAGPGECRQYSASDIDDLATTIGLSPLAEADLFFLLCEDDPQEPHTRFLAVWDSTIDPAERCRLAIGVDFFDGKWELTLAARGPKTECPGVGPNTTRVDLSVAEQHICRAEILRSFTWRRLCATNVEHGHPGAVVITPGSGVETFPPDIISLDTPPPVIVVDGVLQGFHAQQ